MSRLALQENLPERSYEADLHPVQEGLHVREHEDQGKEAWKHQYAITNSYISEEKKRQNIGGLKPWLFWLMIGVISVAVVGASVGGAIGGSKAAKGSSSLAQISVTASSAVTSATSNPSSLVTTDCPSSNGTSFTPKTPGGNPGQYNFIKYCGYDTDGGDLVEAFVVDVDTCIALCSNWNYLQKGGPKCTSASFNVNGSPPGNCWAKTGSKLKVSSRQVAALMQ